MATLQERAKHEQNTAERDLSAPLKHIHETTKNNGKVAQWTGLDHTEHETRQWNEKKQSL